MLVWVLWLGVVCGCLCYFDFVCDDLWLWVVLSTLVMVVRLLWGLLRVVWMGLVLFDVVHFVVFGCCLGLFGWVVFGCLGDCVCG